jgi:hypothetical protein
MRCYNKYILHYSWINTLEVPEDLNTQISQRDSIEKGNSPYKKLGIIRKEPNKIVNETDKERQYRPRDSWIMVHGTSRCVEMR